MSEVQLCPQARLHTPCPEGYIQWHAWAEEMSKTHKQIKCKGCGRYSIWVPKGNAMTDRDAMIEAVEEIIIEAIKKDATCPIDGKCYATLWNRHNPEREAGGEIDCEISITAIATALEPFMQAREQAAREEGRTEGFGWWPIETAPRDGTRIIAADFSPLEFGILGEAGCVCWNASGEYWEDHGFQYCTIQPEPTHWTPLPSPSERNKHRKQQDG